MPTIERIPDAERGVNADEEGHPDGPLARLRAQRKRLEQQGTRWFEHPGYTGLHVTYRRLSSEDTGRILFHGEEIDAVGRNAQLLVEACERIEYRENGDVIKAWDGFNRELAADLGIETDPQDELAEACQIVLGTFGGHDHPMLDHATAVYAWMLTLRKGEDEALVGGSKGTRDSR